MAESREPLRQALENALTEDELAVIGSICSASAVPLSRWHLVPAIARPFVLLAVERNAQVLVRRGVSLKTARQLAAFRLGVEPETLKSWRTRWMHAARRGLMRVRIAPPTHLQSSYHSYDTDFGGAG